MVVFALIGYRSIMISALFRSTLVIEVAQPSAASGRNCMARSLHGYLDLTPALIEDAREGSMPYGIDSSTTTLSRIPPRPPRLASN